METHQLQLIPSEPRWKLDDRTREVGKAGLRNAREILRSTRVDADEVPAERQAA